MINGRNTQIRLDLRKRCVLTAAKRAYTQAVNQALKKAQMDDPELEKRIETLQIALEAMDLASLRGKYPELAGGQDVDVRLQKDAQGRVSLLLQGHELTSVSE